MKLRQRAVIPAEPEVVWPWFADPDRQQMWNEKLIEHTAPPFAELREGSEYVATYRMRPGSPETTVRATVARYLAPFEVVIRYDQGSLGEAGFVLEGVKIERAPDGGSRVQRFVEIHEPRLPWWLRWLAGWIMRTGKPRGPSDLDIVRGLVIQESGGS